MANAYRSVLAGGGTTPTGNATVADVLTGKTFSNENSTGLTGTMPNRGAVSQTLNAGQSYTIPEGYHNGSGVITAASDIFSGHTWHRDSTLANTFATLGSSQTFQMGAFNSGSFLIAFVKGLSGTASVSNAAAKIYKLVNGSFTEISDGTTNPVNYSDCDAIIIQGNTSSSTTYSCTVTKN